MTSPRRFRIDAGAIVTVDDQFRILERHSILISDNTITDIVPTNTLTASDNYPIFDLQTQIIMPGLINAHGHASMTLLRGIANDMPLSNWLEQHIWPAEGRWVNEDFVATGTQIAIAEMLKGGTTTFSDMYFFPEVAASEVHKSGVRAQICCPILDFPTAWGSGPDEYLQKTEALYNTYVDHGRVKVAIGPHAPYTVSDAPLSRVHDLALKTGMPIQMHIHETQQEVDDALANSNMRPLERLTNLGLLSDKLQAVHMTALSDQEVEAASNAKISVIHCPESNMKLASGFCPTPQLMKAGVNVALGTDGAASNNDLDMFGEMRTAALIAKGFSGDASAISAREAIEMATINGARALGLEESIGSIEVGKRADLIALDMEQLNTLPSYELAADIVYNTNSRQVSHVWVDGTLLLENSDLVNMNEHDLKCAAKDWSDKIKHGE